MSSGCSDATVLMRFIEGSTPRSLRYWRTVRFSVSILPLPGFSTKRAIWKSEKPACLTSLIRGSSISDNEVRAWSLCLRSTMFFRRVRNHRSIFVSSSMRSMLSPSSIACAMAKMRRSVGCASSCSTSSKRVWSLPTKPCIPWPIIRRPF